ncbi:hypothetical protein [Rhizobacter sp. OV335]|uniref:hypothetical protein n=1 Tax=Rhizobacter sp. OV335 TaxID=1500264 RepID=UPI0009364150|nr:hypothetical protein [Rhizobacter sp. OV335]
MDDALSFRGRWPQGLRLFWLLLNSSLLFSYLAFIAWYELTNTADRELQGADKVFSVVLSAIQLFPAAVFLLIFLRSPSLLRLGKCLVFQTVSIVLANAMAFLVGFFYLRHVSGFNFS